GCNQIEYNSNFALWCMLAAPLIVNSDIRHLDKATIDLLTNKLLIAIDQDQLGKQGYTISNDGNIQILKKELSNEEYAICIFNRSEDSRDFSFKIKEDLGIWYPSQQLNVWSEKTSSKTVVTGNLQAHACEIYIIKKK
ncbi:MAG: hypothetical protein PHR20_04495, partial [Bacteroidales bacterium]|nr:hypothetical protein [Bacteroidales bacterium]